MTLLLQQCCIPAFLTVARVQPYHSELQTLNRMSEQDVLRKPGVRAAAKGYDAPDSKHNVQLAAIHTKSEVLQCMVQTDESSFVYY